MTKGIPPVNTIGSEISLAGVLSESFPFDKLKAALIEINSKNSVVTLSLGQLSRGNSTGFYRLVVTIEGIKDIAIRLVNIPVWMVEHWSIDGSLLGLHGVELASFFAPYKTQADEQPTCLLVEITPELLADSNFKSLQNRLTPDGTPVIPDFEPSSYLNFFQVLRRKKDSLCSH